MWTPKRIVVLAGTFLAFFGLYLGYAWTAVGRIDGLPPLPETYWPARGDEAEEPIPIRRGSNLENKLRQAFGNNAKELKWSIRLDIRSRGMVLAADDFKVDERGRVLLAPLSIGMIGKEKHDGLPPEINTLRGDVAYLTFDRPVSNPSEISSRKITQIELSGHIQVVNNRRRTERDEDLRVNVDTGTLYYVEKDQRIWTEGLVKLEDFKGKPRPHVIKGKGLEMLLQTETPPAKPNGPKKNDRVTITGVKWVKLGANVDMKLYVEGQTNFMVSPTGQPPVGPLKPGTDKNGKAVQKSELHVTTPGHFRLDLYKDHDLAQFDLQPSGPVPTQAVPSNQPAQVVVKRTNLETKVVDHLVCHHLTLKLARKETPKAKPADAKAKAPPRSGEAVELQAIHAVAPGKGVVLVSHADNVTAFGSDFFHDAIKQLTVLKGEPVDVDKDGSILHARELRIQNVKPAQPAKPGQPEAKGLQELTALGPGDIVFVDKKEGKTLRANWQDLLTSSKDGTQDLLVLTGNARFLDEQNAQTLAADTIKVWLEEVEKKQATPRSPELSSDTRRPRHVEAIGHVVARSRDMNVHDTGRLVVWFKDVPGVARMPEPRRDGRVPATTPGALPPAEPIPPSTPRPLPTGPTKAPAGLTSRPGSSPAPAAGPTLLGQDQQPPARPFDLTARSVESWVLRSPERSTLDQLWCEGKVEVQQEAAKGEEKGTLVKGDTLRMTGQGEGNYELVVTGDLAELLTNKIYITGPEVKIDQAANKAWVIGDGLMRMDSKTNFQGEELAKAVPLTVLWSKSMLFYGDWAEFHGNIQAEQEKARMASQRLQVTFDRPISLKEGNKDGPAPQVKKLVCDREVRVEDSTFVGGQMTKYQRLECVEVTMSALEPDELGVRVPPPVSGAKGAKASAGNIVKATGPGNIRTWEPSTGDDPLGPGQRSTSAKPVAPPGTPPETRITYVSFGQRMDANSRTNVAQFWGGDFGVEVLHLPCPRHDTPIDLTSILNKTLPEKALYIKCKRLKVLDKPEPDGRPNKQMEGYGNVKVYGPDFWANGDTLKYNHLKQQVIITADESGYATLSRVERPGAAPNTVHAKEIIYNRATGQTRVVGALSVSGQSAPPASQPGQPPRK